MKEVKYYSVQKITKEILDESIEIAKSHHCEVRLLWRPNKYNPEYTYKVSEDTDNETIVRILAEVKGPWGL